MSVAPIKIKAKLPVGELEMKKEQVMAQDDSYADSILMVAGSVFDAVGTVLLISGQHIGEEIENQGSSIKSITYDIKSKRVVLELNSPVKLDEDPDYTIKENFIYF